MFQRWSEWDCSNGCARRIGGIAFCPLPRVLTDRYLDGHPADSRAAKPHSYLKPSQVDEAHIAKARALQAMALERGQSLAQMALAWVLRDSVVASALIGASRVEQIDQNVAALESSSCLRKNGRAFTHSGIA